MNQQTTISSQTTVQQEELLRVLTKGMVTIPKPWRELFGFKEGMRIRAKNTGTKIILEPISQPAPYRIYTQEEIDKFLRDDVLPAGLKKRIDAKLGKRL